MKNVIWPTALLLPLCDLFRPICIASGLRRTRSLQRSLFYYFSQPLPALMGSIAANASSLKPSERAQTNNNPKLLRIPTGWIVWCLLDEQVFEAPLNVIRERSPAFCQDFDGDSKGVRS